MPEGVDPETPASPLDRISPARPAGLPARRAGVDWRCRRAANRRGGRGADAGLLTKLQRRLNGGASYQGKFDALPRDTGYGSSTSDEADDFGADETPVPLGVPVMCSRRRAGSLA